MELDLDWNYLHYFFIVITDFGWPADVQMMSSGGNLAENHDSILRDFNLLFCPEKWLRVEADSFQSCTECNTAGSSGGRLNSSRCHVFPSTL